MLNETWLEERRRDENNEKIKREDKKSFVKEFLQPDED
jgi:hypothetical protein